MWRNGLARSHTGIAAYDVGAALTDEHLRLGHSVIIDAVNPIEAPREGWRNLAAKYRADLKIIECVCTNDAIHRQRIEARRRNIDEMPEIPWSKVLERRAEYEPWTDKRLTLDTSDGTPEKLLGDALDHVG